MTRKERILRMVQRQEDDVTYDQVMYHLDVMKNVEIGYEQSQRGEVIEHEQLFERLLTNDEKDSTRMVAKGRAESSKHSRAHFKKRSKNCATVDKSPKKVGREAKKIS